MKWWVSGLLLIGIGCGFYFRFFIFDPLACILMVVMLVNNYAIMNRQQQSADIMTKSHSVLASNQKEISKKLDALMIEVRKK